MHLVFFSQERVGRMQNEGKKYMYVINADIVVTVIVCTYYLVFSICRHASEICRMALDLQAASGMVVRPDIRPKTIDLKCGIHTGPVVAGNTLKSTFSLAVLLQKIIIT